MPNVSLRPSWKPGILTRGIRATYDDRPCDRLWASSNEARATVDASGLVRALAPGWVTVVATYRRNQNAKASALVEVVAR